MNKLQRKKPKTVFFCKCAENAKPFDKGLNRNQCNVLRNNEQALEKLSLWH